MPSSEPNRASSSSSSYADKYALIIGGWPQTGEPEQIFWNDIKDAYDLLIQRGFSDGNIWVPSVNKPIGYDGIVDGKAIRNDALSFDILDAISAIGSEMDDTSNNLLYVAIFGHGAYDCFGTLPIANNALTPYYWNTFASDLNAAIGFGSNARYDAAIFELQPCMSGSAIDDLSTSSGQQDSKRVIFTSTNSDELSATDIVFRQAIFSFNFLNKLKTDTLRAFAWGFWCAMPLPLIAWLVTIGGSLVLQLLGVIAAAVATAAIVIIAIVVVIAGLISGIMAVAGLYLSDTKGWYVSGWEELTMYDVFVYAKGWTQWGHSFWISGTHPQCYNEQLAKEIYLGKQ